MHQSDLALAAKLWYLPHHYILAKSKNQYGQTPAARVLVVVVI
jgi:hypothetical protein